MDEATRERNAGFDLLRADLSHVLEQVAAFVRVRAQAIASTK